MYHLQDLFSRISKKLRLSPQLSLEELSLDIQIERHTIEKAVKECSGSTFRDLRKRSRLQAAEKMLLENPDLTLKEVAYALEYRSLSAFSRFIKTAAGCSPSKLRSQIAAEMLADKKGPDLPVSVLTLKSADD